jgi:hypothetical protein
VALGNMKHDRARLEQDEIAFFISRYLAERLQRAMRRLLQRAERPQTNLVGLACFLQRPANRHVPPQTPAAVG